MNGVGNPIVEVLGESRRVEVAVKVAGIVGDFDLTIDRPAPLGEIEKRPGEGLQHLVVRPAVAQNGRRYRKDDAPGL